MDTQKISIQLDVELHERLVREAARRGQNAPTLARNLLYKALDNLPPVDETHEQQNEISDEYGSLASRHPFMVAPSLLMPKTSPQLDTAPDADDSQPSRLLREQEQYEQERREQWKKWSEAGLKATEAAQAALQEKGASRVYERDGVVWYERTGVVWKEKADGTTQPFEGTPASEKAAL